jgi:undecaprenyl-diphosphatase
MLEIWQALILGVVEGVTEFLPISSTAHLALTSQLLHIAQSEYLKTFEIAIQSGAILAVVALYWQRLRSWRVWQRVLVAFIPTGIIGLLLYKVVKTHLLNNLAVMLWALGLGGVLLIIFEYLYSKKQYAIVNREVHITEIFWLQLLGLGVWQCVALIPGVSRSAATIVGGLLMGLPRTTIVEFSFLLAIPTMLAATGLDVVKNYQLFSPNQAWTLLVGLVTAFAFAALSIRFLLNYVQKHNFTMFGVYRVILVGLVVLLMVW